ncbi:MAG: DNA polymerase III subunit gamma/tau [Desulfobacteraceae bacterium]|nr:DNA polymerase III subunit gamma/tau [Desulfobacteraceae bacterium]MBC2719719.1 DNA polymerase III subunit gamma/tau [Desulfobacteraceae bacterium]
MSYLVLARKYRPQTFDEVIKQNHVTQTLTNAIKSHRVAHAILFTGPRGTGKTTVARILAKAMNCKEGPTPIPCNRCRSCREITSGNAVDVFEIDGASNNGVEQIRSLRENINYMPAHSPNKIYIIDEVHMLSIAAFNALLKTLEEPPSHVMFIFATTEPHKIPVTILSRCQRHDFKLIDIESISNHMKEICSKEHIDITEENLMLIAREAGGSIRDALSLLDQIMACSEGTISCKNILDILGVADRKIIFDISNAILQKDIPETLNVVDEIYDRGYEMKKFYANIIEHFRNLLVVKMGKKINKLINLPLHEINLMQDQVQNISESYLNQIFDLLFKEEVSIRLSAQPKLALEIAFIRLSQIKPVLPIDLLIEKLDNLKKDASAIPANYEVAENEDALKYYSKDPQRISEEPTDSTELKESCSSPSYDPDDNLEIIWNKLLDIFSKNHPALAANLAKCSLKKLTKQNIEIEVHGNDYNINMLKRDKNVAIIKEICSKFFGGKMNLTIKAKNKQNSEKKQQGENQNNNLKQKALSHPLVTDAIEIFNGKVVDVKII